VLNVLNNELREDGMATEEMRARAQGPRADTTAIRPHATELVTEQGKTTIADLVVAKIAGIAAREVAGVHELVTQGVGGAMAGLAQRMTGADTRSQGINVEVGEREAAIDLRLTVDYGVSIPQVAEAVRRNIIKRLEAMTGLIVTEVNIDVSDLYFPEEEAQTQQIQPRVE
jgi:uncharacterized alkaline shock family protein YloU